jgi:hypothetical protein
MKKHMRAQLAKRMEHECVWMDPRVSELMRFEVFIGSCAAKNQGSGFRVQVS